MRILSKAIDIKVVISVIILFLMLPQALVAEEEMSTDFESCILQEYGEPEQSSETAFQIGACFYEIVDARCDHDGTHGVADKSVMPLIQPSPVSSQIILQYADSWFVLAAKDGHQAAVQQLAKTRLKLGSSMP